MCYCHVKDGWYISWGGIEGDILGFTLAKTLADWEKRKVSRGNFLWNPIPCPGMQARLGDLCQSWILCSVFCQRFKQKTDCCSNRTYWCLSNFFPLKIFLCSLRAFLLSMRIFSHIFWPSVFVLQLPTKCTCIPPQLSSPISPHPFLLTMHWADGLELYGGD